MTAELRDELARLCGAESVSQDGARYRLGDRVPGAVVRPGTEDEVSRVLALASARGAAVAPWGGGRHQSLAAPPRRYDLALDLSRLDRVIAYEPGDMTATVQAGIRLDALQRLLEGQGQFFPLDPPGGDAATLGGMVASLQSGPLRCRYGSARDLVLGVRVAHADGTITNAGSRVVKNATAYDITKLYVGSFGTLAVFLAMTLRIHPRPAVEQGWVLTGAGLDRIHAFALQLLGSHLAPSRMELLTQGAAGGIAAAGPALAVSFGGVAEAVADQAGTLGRLAQESGLDVREIGAADAWDPVRNFPRPLDPDGDACWRGGVLATDAAKALEAIRAAMPAGVAVAGAATVSHGTLRGVCRASDPAALVPALQAARRALEALGGYLVASELPVAIREQVDVWGRPPDDIELLRKLRLAFDPAGILNPGRLLDL
jgi:glycolate oxidase FAD binding subunit